MRFWDASAVIPLLSNEPSRERLLARLEQDPQVLIWWGTTVEIASALARREREQLLTADEVTHALALVRQLADSWHEIAPSDAVRRTAERLLRTAQAKGFAVSVSSVDGKGLYRVRTNGLVDHVTAQGVLQRLREQGFAASIVTP